MEGGDTGIMAQFGGALCSAVDCDGPINWLIKSVDNRFSADTSNESRSKYCLLLEKCLLLILSNL